MRKIKLTIILCLFGLTSCRVSPSPSILPTSATEYSNIIATSVNPTSTITFSTISGSLTEQRIENWIFYWKSTPVRSFTFDDKGTVWLGWRGKVVHLIPATGSFVEFDFEQAYDINEIVVDNSGDIWTAAPIFQYSNDKWSLFNLKYSSPFTLSVDNAVWATSNNAHGADCIVHYTKQAWVTLCPDINNTDVRVHDLAVDKDSNVWISFRDEFFFNQGVWKLTDDKLILVNELSDTSLSPYQISQAPDGALWFVSPKHIETGQNGYVKKYDGTSWPINVENREIVSQTKIAPDNTLWGYTTDNSENYIIKFENNEWEKVLSETELDGIFQATLHIYTFDFDQLGRLCLGTNLGFLCKTK